MGEKEFWTAYFRQEYRRAALRWVDHGAPPRLAAAQRVRLHVASLLGMLSCTAYSCEARALCVCLLLLLLMLGTCMGLLHLNFLRKVGPTRLGWARPGEARPAGCPVCLSACPPAHSQAQAAGCRPAGGGGGPGGRGGGRAVWAVQEAAGGTGARTRGVGSSLGRPGCSWRRKCPRDQGPLRSRGSGALEVPLPGLLAGPSGLILSSAKMPPRAAAAAPPRPCRPAAAPSLRSSGSAR